MDDYVTLKLIMLASFLFFSVGMIGGYILGPTEFSILSQDFVNSHNYTRESYNCVNYSVDFHYEALKEGYFSRYISGCNEEACHRWLCMDYDAITGSFVNYNDKYPKQVVHLNDKAKPNTG